jgi:hypothetical protein
VRDTFAGVPELKRLQAGKTDLQESAEETPEKAFFNSASTIPNLELDRTSIVDFDSPPISICFLLFDLLAFSLPVTRRNRVATKMLYRNRSIKSLRG